MHIQLVTSLVSIAGAAAIALACDFLRARNAQLKEAVVQMKTQSSGPGPGPKPTGPRRQSVRPTADAVTPAPAPKPAVAMRSEEVPAPLTVPEFTTRGGRRAPGTAGSNPALSAWLIERAEARAAQKTEEEAAPEAEPETPTETPVPAPTLSLVPAPEVKETIVIDAQLWGSLCGESPAPPRPGLELVRGTGSANNFDVRVPAGMQSSTGLSPLLESGQFFTGLVISIGANLVGARETMQTVEEFIAGLLRNTDFGCRNDEDEFLLICPGLHGAEAQRHLAQVSERLWDYQLRTLGQFSIAFSLGGIDIQRDNLADAIASAKERMSLTRRRTAPVEQKRRAG